LTHLQFEAMLTAGRESSNPNDFALVAMLGLLGLRIFEATGIDVTDLGEEHGHRVLRVVGKGTRVVLASTSHRTVRPATDDVSAGGSRESPCSSLGHLDGRPTRHDPLARDRGAGG
jgi:hypothetical protein